MAEKTPIFIVQENPDLLYRAVANKHGSTVANVFDDFLRSGQIRGTQRYGGDAYFLRGSYWDPIASPQSYAKGLTTWSEPYTSPLPNNAPRSMKISVDPTALNPAENPLYGEAGGARNRFASNPRNFPVPVNSMEPSAYPVLQPNKNPGFIDTFNPANRAGIRMQANTGQIFYDRITPLLDRPMSTHAANIATEARIMGNAIRANPVGAAGTALGAAGAALSVYDMYNRAQQSAKTNADMRQNVYDAVTNSDGSFPYVSAFMYETGARMPGYLEALANTATFGVYDELTNHQMSASNQLRILSGEAKDKGRSEAPQMVGKPQLTRTY